MAKGYTVGKADTDPAICGWCKWCEEGERSPDGKRVGECFAYPPTTPAVAGFAFRYYGPKVTLDRKACCMYQRRII